MKTEFHICPVDPPYQKFIQFIWISKGENDQTKTKILPNGAIELILNFGKLQKTLSSTTLKTKAIFKNYWIAGVQTKPIIIQSINDTNLIGIRFLPGGAYPFFKTDISKYTDRVIEADWMAEELDKVRLNIKDLNDISNISMVIHQYLKTKFDEQFQINEAVAAVIDKICNSDNGESVSDLVKNSGYSHKHFLSIFKQQVGTSPKNLQRIIRLQKVIQIVKDKPNVKWLDIMYQFPYYDPAHFAHDFKNLTGMTAEKYLTLRTFDENHCLIR